MTRFASLTSTLIICLLGTSAGCSSFAGKSFWKWADTPVKRFAEGKPGTPTNMVAIWTDSVYSEPGQAALRGLGGRVYFYDAQHRTIQVDGKLVVYAYDDSQPGSEEQREPTRKFVFDAEQVAKQFSPSEFGPSYSVWIPWDEIGNAKAKLSLIPVFTTSDGDQVVGEQARHVLPGKEEPTVVSQETKTFQKSTKIQRASFEKNGSVKVTEVTQDGMPQDGTDAETNASDDQESRSHISTNTITLTPSLRNRLIAAAAENRDRRTSATSDDDAADTGVAAPEGKTAPASRSDNLRDPAAAPTSAGDRHESTDSFRQTSALDVQDERHTRATYGNSYPSPTSQQSGIFRQRPMSNPAGSSATGAPELAAIKAAVDERQQLNAENWLGAELPLVKETVPAKLPTASEQPYRFSPQPRGMFGKWPAGKEISGPPRAGG